MSQQDIDAVPNAFPTTWSPPQRSNLQHLHTQSQEMGNPERIAQLISVLLRLEPLRIPIQLKQCGKASAFYNGNTRKITICYEHLVAANRLLGISGPDQYQLSSDTSAVLVFTALHEIAHALIDTLGLRLRGNDEDLADRFAILLVLRAGDQKLASQFVGAPAVFFRGHAREVQRAGGHSADDPHATSEKRARDMTCLLYATNRSPALEKSLGMPAKACLRWARAAKQEWNKSLRRYTRVNSGNVF